MIPLQERARRARERAVIRAWEYRQRNHSHGVWYRLRRVLVDADQLWVIDGRDADRLEAGGREPHPVGRELSPPLRLFRVTTDELATIASRRQIAVRVNADFLEARCLAYIPHKS
jgi:hypothetical protein